MNRKQFAYFFILIGLTLDNLCLSAGFTITESLEEKLHEDYVTVSWVISAYAVTLGSFIILLGKLGDILGLHKVFLAGLVLMSITALINALVPKAIPLIIFRAIQGVSAAALIPTGMGLTASYFQGDQLLLAIRLLMLVLTSSGGFGIVLGGAFSVTKIGYRAFFYFNFAVSTVCFVALWFLIIPVEPHQSVKIKNLDYGGAFFLVVGMLLIIVGFTEAGANWNSAKVYVTIPVGAAIVFGVALYEIAYISQYQKKHPDSDDWRSKLAVLFPLELNKVRLYVLSCCGSLFHYCAYTVLQLGLIQFHEEYDHDSPLIAALRVLPIVAAFVFGTIIWRPVYVQKVEDRYLIMASAIICIGMTAWSSKFQAGQYWRYELVSLFILGWVVNIYYQIVFATIITQVPLHLQANASGIFQTFGQIGVALGSAVTASIVGTNKSMLKENVGKCFYLVYACYAAVFVMFAANTLFTKMRGSGSTQDNEKEPATPKIESDDGIVEEQPANDPSSDTSPSFTPNNIKK